VYCLRKLQIETEEKETKLEFKIGFDVIMCNLGSESCSNGLGQRSIFPQISIILGQSDTADFSCGLLEIRRISPLPISIRVAGFPDGWLPQIYDQIMIGNRCISGFRCV
jgi:hypothetical protein